jgi:hypothetical protein
MHPHRLGHTFGAQFAASVLEVADQFLLLGVDRDGRLAGRLKAADLGVDMLELGIAIGMAGSFARLAVGLETEAQTPQQPADQLMADRKAALPQRPGEMPLALTDPQQGRLRIAPRMADWTSSPSASSSLGCRSIAALRPPPARRTRPPRSSAPPRNSANPRPMVLRAMAVAALTAWIPP